MWSMCLVASTSAGSFFSLKSIFDYLKYTTVTSIDIIKEEQTLFPAVSICAEPSFESSWESVVKYARFDRTDLNKSDFNRYFTNFSDPQYGKF